GLVPVVMRVHIAECVRLAHAGARLLIALDPKPNEGVGGGLADGRRVDALARPPDDQLAILAAKTLDVERETSLWHERREALLGRVGVEIAIGHVSDAAVGRR